MLLPPQFQTPAPDALGAKATAMPAPPKPPHEHQWVAVPDSKIHSRCAECGTVTLTEIVSPKVIAYAQTASSQAMLGLLAEVNGQIERAVAAYVNGLGAGRSAYLERHLCKPYIGEPKWVAHAQGGQMPVMESERVEVLLSNGSREKDYAGFVVDWAKVKQYRVVA